MAAAPVARQDGRRLIAAARDKLTRQARKPSPTTRDDPKYTTIEEVFRLELLIIRLLGGYPFDWPLVWSVIYRVLVMLLARYYERVFLLDYAELRNALNTLMTLNIRLSLVFFHMMTNATCIVSIVTGARNKRIFEAVLRKRLDRRYLESGRSAQRSAVQPASGRTQSSLSSSSTSVLSEWARKFKLASQSSSSSSSKIGLLRRLLICNIIFTAATSCIRDAVIVSIGMEVAARANGTGELLTPTDPPTSRQQQSGLSPDLAAGDLGNMAQQVAWLCVPLVHASIHVSQLYGLMLVDFMISASLADMMDYAATFDGLVLRQRDDKAVVYRAGNSTVDAELEVLGSLRRAHRNGRSRLLTSDLLIQVRDVLLILSKALNVKYLIVLVYDISRLMCVFFVMTAMMGSEQIHSASMIVLDYVRISFNMLFCRLGIYWVHNEARRIKFALAETRLLDEGGEPNDDESDRAIERHTARPNELVDIKRAEIITTTRLAGQIEHLWPTDWFKPDMQNHLTHNFFVITFVATMQQLVEVGLQSG